MPATHQTFHPSEISKFVQPFDGGEKSFAKSGSSELSELLMGVASGGAAAHRALAPQEHFVFWKVPSVLVRRGRRGPGAFPAVVPPNWAVNVRSWRNVRTKKNGHQECIEVYDFPCHCRCPPRAPAPPQSRNPGYAHGAAVLPLSVCHERFALELRTLSQLRFPLDTSIWDFSIHESNCNCDRVLESSSQSQLWQTIWFELDLRRGKNWTCSFFSRMLESNRNCDRRFSAVWLIMLFMICQLQSGLWSFQTCESQWKHGKSTQKGHCRLGITWPSCVDDCQLREGETDSSGQLDKNATGMQRSHKQMVFKYVDAITTTTKFYPRHSTYGRLSIGVGALLPSVRDSKTSVFCV